MSDIYPTELHKTENRQLVIIWSDGVEQVFPYRMLRDACQCATCMSENTSANELPAGTLPVLTAAQAQPLEILSMNPVGNYAYNIGFSDGHSTGIFTFEMLRNLPVDSES